MWDQRFFPRFRDTRESPPFTWVERLWEALFVSFCITDLWLPFQPQPSQSGLVPTAGSARRRLQRDKAQRRKNTNWEGQKRRFLCGEESFPPDAHPPISSTPHELLCFLEVRLHFSGFQKAWPASLRLAAARASFPQDVPPLPSGFNPLRLKPRFSGCCRCPAPGPGASRARALRSWPFPGPAPRAPPLRRSIGFFSTGPGDFSPKAVPPSALALRRGF